MTNSSFKSIISFRYLGGVAPVQVEGTVAGNPFYFRARHQGWTFAISENPDISPIAISSEIDGRKHGYFRESSYGSEPFAASWMPREEAKRIIFECFAAYLDRLYLNDRAKRVSRQKFEIALTSIPDVDPDEWDSL